MLVIRYEITLWNIVEKCFRKCYFFGALKIYSRRSCICFKSNDDNNDKKKTWTQKTCAHIFVVDQHNIHIMASSSSSRTLSDIRTKWMEGVKKKRAQFGAHFMHVNLFQRSHNAIISLFHLRCTVEHRRKRFIVRFGIHIRNCCGKFKNLNKSNKWVSTHMSNLLEMGR